MTPSELDERWRRLLAGPRVRIAGVVLALVAIAAVAMTTTHEAARTSWAELVPTGARQNGWSVGPPQRGTEHDVVFSVRRGAEHVEIHVVPRGQWEGVPETRSFGVGYEAPRTSASAQDAVAVAAWVADELAPRDTGALGSIDAIPLERSSSSWLASLAGVRALALALAVLTLLLALPRTPRVVALALLVVGLALRAIELGLPFARDQDVQRLLSGALPLGEILFGRGLDDRHPPLWFLVLHVAELGGQSEAVARMPSVLAGALVAPAIVWAVHEARPADRVSSIAVACGAVAAMSPALIGAAREVSEIAFFSLTIVSLVAMALRAERDPSRANQLGVALMHALVLWTYYTGVFVIAAVWVVHFAMHRERTSTERALRRASLAGLALGAPALALAIRIALRDSGARMAAHAHPDIAWGDATPLGMLSASAACAVDAIGTPLLVLAIGAGTFVRAEASRVALAIAMTVALGTAALASIARVQPYYVLAIVPVVLLALAAARTEPTWRGSLATACVVVASAFFFASSGPALAARYTPDPDAVVPRYLARCRAEHVERIATVASYDATLLAYYAARASSRSIAWRDVDSEAGWLAIRGRPHVGLLAQSHASDDAPGPHAAERLRAWMRQGPIAVMARDTFSLAEVDAILAHCTPLDRSAGTRLVLCAEPP